MCLEDQSNVDSTLPPLLHTILDVSRQQKADDAMFRSGAKLLGWDGRGDGLIGDEVIEVAILVREGERGFGNTVMGDGYLMLLTSKSATEMFFT